MSDRITEGPVEDVTKEAERILEAAHAEEVPLRLLGGLAIYFQSSSAREDERLKRSYGDMDFATLSQASSKVKTLFADLGYVGNKAFNSLHGYQRLIFKDEQNDRKIDIFVDRMQMCHTLDFRARLHLERHTLPLSDLLMTKLQIVEINEKDMTDIVALLHDHDVVEHEQGISAPYISGLTAQDWGLYKTFEQNLQKIHRYALERSFPERVPARVKALLSSIEQKPKSMKWKARAVVGERVRWYELPEEGR